MQLIEQLKEHWATIAVVLLVFQNFVKGLRDALDKTPDTDDNPLEKAASVITKLLGYLVGFRAK